MRMSMGAIIHRARWNFNVDEADGVSGRDTPSWRSVPDSVFRETGSGESGSFSILASRVSRGQCHALAIARRPAVVER